VAVEQADPVEHTPGLVLDRNRAAVLELLSGVQGDAKTDTC
jgi:hypothetical protein